VKITIDDLLRRTQFIRERFGVPIRLASKNEISGEDMAPRWVLHRDVAIDHDRIVPQPISAPLSIPAMYQFLEGYEAGCAAGFMEGKAAGFEEGIAAGKLPESAVAIVCQR
jgi:hypothetical protein